MNFLFDARYIRTDFHDGISRYSTELATAVAKITPVTFIICDPAQAKFLPAGAKTIHIHGPTSSREPFTARILNRYHPDVVFSPMQTMGSAGRTFKLILTLHDMIYYRHRTPPRNLSAIIRLGWRAYHLTYTPQRLALNGADVVATVSETSKHDFERTRLTKRPVIVVPNAPQKLAQYLQKPITTKRPRNLVYMGSFMPYKNVETLLRGMEFLPNYTLHLLSRIAPKRQQQLRAHIPTGANVVFHGGVSDEEYAHLLANNAIMVSASLDEGYGLPLAEALELGVPAVVSNLPIFHEVAGEGARYFAPTNPRDFAETVLSLEQTSERTALTKKGQVHIARYSWDTSAHILVRAIKELL
jgi:glycosyltransferase involved in cell wall biosynthesis